MGDDPQNPSVIETETLNLEGPVESSNGGKISYRKHHANLDAFVDECNHELRTVRGLHACEAFVTATWKGEAMLTRVEMTTRGIVPMNAILNLPWVMPADKRQTGKEIVTDALIKLDLFMRDQCARNGGLLRQGFEAVARKTERILIPSGVDAGR
jgi:hypothetical protein